MLGSFIARLAVRTFLPLIVLVAFVLSFYHLQAQADLDAATETVNASLRSASYVKDESPIQFEEISKFGLSDKMAAAQRTDIKTDEFGDVYVSMDGSDIAIGDSGFLYSEREPAWTAVSGEARVFKAMPKDGRLVLIQSPDGGRTFPLEGLISPGFRNAPASIQGNVRLRHGKSDIRLYNVFLSAGGNEVRLASCTASCSRLTVQTVYMAPPDRKFDHPYPFVSLDRARGIHVVFSDGHDIFLISSADEGDSWTQPVRVNETPASAGSGFPVIAAGDAGRVAIAWLHGSQLLLASSADVFAASPVFHSTLIPTEVPASIAPSLASDLAGSIWLSFRTATGLSVMRQVSGEGLKTSSVWSAAGDLASGKAKRRLSLNVRSDLTGEMVYQDLGLPMLMRADQFKVNYRDDGQISISGEGKLKDGSTVAFTLLGPRTLSSSVDVSLSMSNGYYAGGTLNSTKTWKSRLKLVTQGGNVAN
jgi:hypothetical protein